MIHYVHLLLLFLPSYTILFNICSFRYMHELYINLFIITLIMHAETAILLFGSINIFQFIISIHFQLNPFSGQYTVYLVHFYLFVLHFFFNVLGFPKKKMCSPLKYLSVAKATQCYYCMTQLYIFQIVHFLPLLTLLIYFSRFSCVCPSLGLPLRRDNGAPTNARSRESQDVQPYQQYMEWMFPHLHPFICNHNF